MSWLPLAIEVVVFLLGLAGAMGVLKKGQADMEKQLERERAEFRDDLKEERAELKTAFLSFRADLSRLGEALMSVDKLATVTQSTVDRMLSDSQACRMDCQLEQRRQAKAITAMEIWKAAANQEIRQIDSNWEGA